MIKNALTYLGVGIIYLFSLLPHFVLYRISDFLFFVFYHLIGYRRKVVFNNLKNSFPEKETAELKRIEKAFYKNLADIIIETVKEFSISESQMKKRFKFVNPEVFDHFHKKNQSVMMMMGHYNNWEYAVSTSLWIKQDFYAVYGRIKNKIFNKYLVKTREKFGLNLFPMEKTYEAMLSHKQGNNLYMFMADQSPHHGRIKFWLDFLNQETPVHIGAENLSRKLNLGVVFIEIKRVKRGYYEVNAEILFEDPNETEKFEITKKYFKTLEEIITRKPENWLWSHKRWKHKKEFIENKTD